jgi:Big-like domain-containing protein
MRAFMVAVALLAVPFAVSVSQEPEHGDRDRDAQHSSARRENDKQCAKFAAHRDNDNNQGEDQDKDHAKQCGDPSTPPPPPPPPAPSCGPAVAGNASVSGTITSSAGLALANACVSVYDATGALIAGGLANSTGNYTVSVVANGGNLSVCATAPSGATQTSPMPGTFFPACPGSGFGSWTFPVASGDAAIMLNFVF